MAEPSEASILAHGEALERLRPPGLAWTTDAHSVSRQLYTALGTELARVTGRAADLIREADPRTSVELLEDWERVLGLPGPCGELEPTVVLRQFAVHAKLIQPGGSSRQHYIDQASGLGITITIEEFLPFKVGVSKCGDKLTNGDWVFTWRTHHPVASGQFLSVGSGVIGEPLLEISAGTLECFLTASKPSHTHLLFAADGSWDGWAPWETIYPEPAVLVTAPPGPIVLKD